MKYILELIRGVRVERSKLRRSIWTWPHKVIHIKPESFKQLLTTLGANHMHAVEGDYTQELEKFCQIKNIKPHKINP